MTDTPLPILGMAQRPAGNLFGLKKKQATGSSSGPYQYAPLAAQQIRVVSVSIEPSTGFVVCSFEHRDLASSLGSYRAISYCWGDPTAAYRLLFNNGQSIVITKSCAEILTHVVPQHPTDLYWIDQLCINQNNNAEKSVQVLLMGEIYSSTKQVSAWLGCGAKETEKALDFIKTLYDEIEDTKRKGHQPTLEPLMSQAVRIRNLPTEMQRERKWSALSKFLRNVWFERCWVMQEVIMACAKTSHLTPQDQQHVVLCFEKCQLGFDVLAEVLRVLENDNLLLNAVYDRQNSDGTTEAGVDPVGVNAINLYSFFRESRRRGTPVLLNSAVSRAWHFKATNARDKLFAILGFCDDVASIPLRPDHEATVEDVYISWAAAMLERADDYPMAFHMAGIGLQRTYSNLPSWVPDFSTSSYEVQLKPQTAGSTVAGTYRATGTIDETGLTIDHLSQSLQIQGILIDTVEAVFPQPVSSQKKDPWYKSSILTPEKAKYKSILRWLDAIQEFQNTSTTVSETRVKQILWQTMVGNYNPTDIAAEDSNLSQAFDNWCQSHRELAGKDKAGFSASQSRKPDFYDQIQTFEHLKATSLQDRPVFGTAQKRLLGHGPKGLVVGDIVCLLKGTLTPFLIREDAGGVGNKGWKLVGACFVHGVMYGEGLRMGRWEDLAIV